MQAKDFELNHILRNKQDHLFLRCVYFLIKNNEIIYVGQTENLHQRLCNHKEKKFDSFSFIEITEKENINDIELFYINKFNPILNSDFDKFKFSCETKNNISKLLLRLSNKEYVEFLEKNNIRYFKKNRLVFTKKEDNEKIKKAMLIY